MRFATICSGIGAPEKAWESLGFEPVFSSEIDNFPSIALNHHYPDVPNLGDMNNYKEWNDYEQLGLICGGTPCQSFSVAGLRKGMDDPRGNLALVFLGIIARYSPQWVLWENVPGVLSSNRGRDFGAFLGGLGKLGYTGAYRVLDAQFYGVPQRRRRVFVVGYLGNDWRPPFAVLFEPESLRGNIKKVRREKEKYPQYFKDNSSESGENKIVPIVFESSRRHGVVLQNSTSPTLQAFMGTGGNNMPMVCHCDNDCNQGDQVIVMNNDRGGRMGQNGPIYSEEGTSFTLNTLDRQTVSYKNIVRRLTPRECERLQGFPDDYTLIPVKKVNRNRLKSPKVNSNGVKRYIEINGEVWQLASDGPRYKALGNSMAVPVVRWIGRRIKLFEEVNKT